MPTGTIYCLCDPATDEVRYVGWAFDAEKRLKRHVKNARRGQKQPVYGWVRSLGEWPPVMKPLELGVEEHLLPTRERWWIADLKARGCPLLNATSGGDTLGGSPAATREAAQRGGHKGGRKGALATNAALTPEQHSERGRAMNTTMTPEQRRRGGLAVNALRYRCGGCDRVMSPGNLGYHQKASGHSGRVLLPA